MLPVIAKFDASQKDAYIELVILSFISYSMKAVFLLGGFGSTASLGVFDSFTMFVIVNAQIHKTAADMTNDSTN